MQKDQIIQYQIAYTYHDNEDGSSMGEGLWMHE